MRSLKMVNLIESLESRTFLSAAPVTSATLAADQSAIAVQSAAVAAAVKTLAAQTKTELAAITADVKGLARSNAPLLSKVKLDVNKLTSATNTDGNSILKSSGALAKKALATGASELQAFSPKSVAALTTDSATLNGILVAPLGKLQVDLGGPLISDLGPLGSANPTATQLASDIAALSAAYSAASNALTAAAVQYQASITGLATDLTTIASGVPNIVFTYTGTATQTGGKNAGKKGAVSLTITVEAADGSWTGTLSAPNGAGIQVTHLAQGKVTATGAFTGNFSSSSGVGELLTGQVSGNSIKGTVQGANGSGTFSIAH